MVMNADEEGIKVKDGVSREQMSAKSLGIGFCFVWMQRIGCSASS